MFVRHLHQKQLNLQDEKSSTKTTKKMRKRLQQQIYLPDFPLEFDVYLPELASFLVMI